MKYIDFIENKNKTQRKKKGEKNYCHKNIETRL